MEGFQNILLVCDQHPMPEAVIERAVWLAQTNEGQITLVDILEAPSSDLSNLFGALPDHGAREFERDALAFREAQLKEVASAIAAEGVTTIETILRGIPFVEIIRKVHRDGHDLVMKAAVENGASSLFFASPDLHLMRKCPCPVWVMKKRARPQYARILAAVDPDSDDATRDALNNSIMELSTSLAASDGSELHVVNVWRLNEEETLRHSGFARIDDAEVDVLVEEKRKRSEAELGRLLARFPSDRFAYHSHLLKGAARDVIPEFAAQQGVELIVMGTVARTGIRGFIIGNTAEAILSKVHCSVLALKPPGFESPVHPE